MAAFHGKQGRVTFAYVADPESGIISNVLSWSIEATCEVADATIMSPVAVVAATHWKDYIAGFMVWTATVECDLDDSGLDPDFAADFIDDDGAALVLYSGIQAQGVRKYSGVGIATGISPSVDKDGVAKVTYTFQGSGVLTETASDYVPA